MIQDSYKNQSKMNSPLQKQRGCISLSIDLFPAFNNLTDIKIEQAAHFVDCEIRLWDR